MVRAGSSKLQENQYSLSIARSCSDLVVARVIRYSDRAVEFGSSSNSHIRVKNNDIQLRKSKVNIFERLIYI